jgi:hypothetical protein
MIRAIEQRLRKLEAADNGPQRLHIVFSMNSDEADWDSQIAELISSGEASAEDEFMRIGWRSAGCEQLVPQQNAPG